MDNKIISTAVSNPSLHLFQSHEKDILSTRESLFKFLNEKSPRMSSAVEQILKRKLNKPGKENLPAMFELFPWIIKDLTGLSWKKTHDISLSWLAINIYVSFLDDHLDSKSEINADEFLGASVLSQKGLLNLYKIVSGTKFEKLFNDSLFSSANYQLEDVLNQRLVSQNFSEKSKSASGKNQILIACAGALAAAKQSDSKFIIQLTKEILLSVQYLDDLADLEIDYRSENITVLLNEVAKDKKIDSKKYKRHDLIEGLVSTGSLLSVIRTIESSIATYIILIENNKVSHKKSNPSYQFFTALYFEVLQLKILLESYDQTFSELPSKNKTKIVEKVEKAITKIYLHT